MNNDRRDFIKMLSAGFFSTAIPGCFTKASSQAESRSAGKKLNFVFILVDDLGWKDLSVYGSSFT